MQFLKKVVSEIDPASLSDCIDPSEADGIEVDFRSADFREIHRRVLEKGCCLLRNALPDALVLGYRDKIEEMYRSIAARLNAGEKISDHDRVNIRDHQFTAVHGEDNSFFHLLKNPKFATLMDNLFGKGRYAPVLSESCTRSIHVNDVQRDATSFSPLSIHFDGIYHDTWPYFSINFWIPFSACGAGTNAPGLMVYPADFREVRRYLRLDTAGDLGKNVASAENPQPMNQFYPLLEELYRARNINPVTPRFEIGDVMLINSWTPHGTFWDGKMSDCRRNLEIRFQGDSWDPLLPA